MSELARLRKAKRLSQLEIGRRIGVSHTSVGNWERGLNIPSIKHAVLYAEILGIPVTRLYQLIVMARSQTGGREAASS